MKYIRSVFTATLLSCMALSVIGFGQTRVGFSPTATATVGHADSTLHLNNVVRFDWRHCQNYTKEIGHLWWKYLVVDNDACNADPSTIFKTEYRHNLVTNAGFDFISSALSNTAAQPASCNYIAMANDTSNANVGTVAATDTTIASSGTGSTEIAANGLSRTIGTYAHTTGTKTYTVANTFNATGTQASNKTGLFNASSSGTMCYEVLYTQVTV